MARWENEQLWDARGNYLGTAALEKQVPVAFQPHQCSDQTSCGVFICPSCCRPMPWCWGAADGPECDECWAQKAPSAAYAHVWREQRLDVLRVAAGWAILLLFLLWCMEVIK